MPECKKCGYKTREDISFCPNCGAPVKAEQVPVEQRPATGAPSRSEKAEKQEKHEKGEKQEKREKGEYGFIGPLIGGVVLIIIGLASYISVTGLFSPRDQAILGAIFVVIIGVAVILGALYAMTTARKRHPPT